MNYQPRGALAKAIFDKYRNDSFLNQYDTTLWYSLRQELPLSIQSKFLPLYKPDEITINWIENAKTLSLNIWMHIWHAIVRSILQLFMTQTDINGFLRRGSMFILSENQFALLLRSGGFSANKSEIVNVLDIGAGDGEISLRLVNSLHIMQKKLKIQVFATETSWAMRKRLKRRGFNVIDSFSHLRNIQLISCLNVLDRCIDPLQLLEDIYSILAPNGRLILALVLPYIHYVEFTSSHLPLKPLMSHWPSKAKQYSFEKEALIFFDQLRSYGFQVESWTKAPYLCEGDLHQSFYWLIDLVVVLSKIELLTENTSVKQKTNI